MTSRITGPRIVLALSCFVALAFGCTKSESDNPFGETTSRLQKVANCNNLLDGLQSDGAQKLAYEVQALRQWYVNGEGYGWGGRGIEEDLAGNPEAPSAGGDDGESQDGDAKSPTGHSDTNTQVAGVDEADIVKISADGERLYVVSDTKLYVLGTWPADETALLATLELGGYGNELFVDGNTAVVFSVASDVPEELLPDVQDGGDSGGKPAADVACPQPVGEGDAVACGSYSSFTKISVIDLADDEPKVEREIFYEGYYASSRRHDESVRAILQTNLSSPVSKGIWEYEQEIYLTNGGQELTKAQREEIVGKYESEALAAIASTTLEDWLPTFATRVDGEVELVEPSCESFYIPGPAMTDYGITSIIGLSTSDDTLTETSIMGWASTVYASGDTLVIAQPDWSAEYREDSTDQSLIHRFTLADSSTKTTYDGSGFVPGMLKDQFALDESDGILRVATTVNRWDWEDNGTGTVGVDVGTSDPDVPPEADSDSAGSDDEEIMPQVEPLTLASSTFPIGSSATVTTLKLVNGDLEAVGSTGPLAPGERIYSTRYVGDTGYVVTFRQVDPLFVIDLSDAANPKVLAELKIPGFSEYMHPLDEGHLLTIGQSATDDGVITGLALQIFDVSNPASPKLAHKYEFSSEGYSEASYSHKAFTFYADKGLLAFPYVKYYPDFESSLEIFEVDAESGFDRVGAVSHTELVTNACGDIDTGEDAYWSCEYAPDVRRGIFISDDATDYIYSLSWSGLMVHNLSDLDTSLASVAF